MITHDGQRLVDLAWMREHLDALPPVDYPVILEPASTYDTLAAERGDPLLDLRRRQLRKALTLSVPDLAIAVGPPPDIHYARTLWMALRLPGEHVPPDLWGPLRRIVHGMVV